jgi:hypothetical protein
MADWQGQMGGGAYGAGYPGYGGAQPQGQPQGQPHGAVDQAKEKAQQLAGEAKQQAGQRLETSVDRGKTRAADALRGVAQTLTQSGRQLREQQQPGGEYVERAAERVQRFSDYLQRTDVHQLVDQVEDVARRQPALFLGGMFALGVIGARFLRSSRRGAASERDGYAGYSRSAGYDAGAYGSTGYGAGGVAGGYGATAPQYGTTPSYGAGGGVGGSVGGAGSTGGTYGTTGDYGGNADTDPYGRGSQGGGYGAGQYGGPSYGAGQYGDAASTTPRDRDVTARQPLASEPPYGTTGGGGSSSLGQESFRRADRDPRDDRP